MSLPQPKDGGFVLVTGAASGIGEALAHGLSKRGYDLLLADRDADSLEEVAGELRAEKQGEVRTHVCDLTVNARRNELIKLVLEGSGRRTLLGVCNNAGIMSYGRFDELPYAREKAMVEVNAVAVHHLCGRLLPTLVESGEGAVLNTASMAANQPLPNAATYAATKAFVHFFSEALHTELRETGVSVTSLQPMATRTALPENAGLADEAVAIPGPLWGSARSVAEEGIEAMIAGRRTVTPGLFNRVALSPAGRLMPRGFGLPALMRLVEARRRQIAG
jgi:short-subunit dehydrogenase